MFFHPAELKKQFPFFAKKQLGQNFLVHRPILETIARKILEHRPNTILEIGPGPGSLSQLIVAEVEQMILVEKDEQFKEVLQKILGDHTGQGKVVTCFDDFLEIDLESLLAMKPKPIFAVGNLPYNVSVPILKKLLEHRNLFGRFYLMFQREVAERLTAKPSTPAYGSLSLYCQMLSHAKLILPIPPSAFWPRPKIDSAVVEFIPFPTARFEGDLPLFEKVIQASFATRRKTLLNSLSSHLALQGGKAEWEKLLSSLGISPQIRAENLKLEDFVKIVQTLRFEKGNLFPLF